MTDGGDDPQEETDEVYTLHYSVLVPRTEDNKSNADYFRYGTPNEERNFDNDTKSIEKMALDVLDPLDWASEAGEAGIFGYTTEDRTTVVQGGSVDYVRDDAKFYFGEKHEIVGDENTVEGVRTRGSEAICYELGATTDYEAHAALRLEFDASLTSAVKVGGTMEASYGLAFESGLVAAVKLKSEKEFGFTAGGGFETGMGEYSQQKEFAFVGDDSILMTIMPADIGDGTWKQLLLENTTALAGLTHVANGVFLAFAARSIADMKSIQKDAKNIDQYVDTLKVISVVQAALAAIWLVVGIIRENKIKTWLAVDDANRDMPFLKLDEHGHVTISTGQGASISMHGDTITLSAATVTATSSTGNMTVQSTDAALSLSGQTGATLASAGGETGITGQGIASQSGPNPWEHTGAFTANGAITLGQTAAQALNVNGAPVVTRAPVVPAPAQAGPVGDQVNAAPQAAGGAVARIGQLLGRLNPFG